MRKLLISLTLLLSASALASSEMPSLNLVNYEAGMIIMRTADVIPKSSVSSKDQYVVMEYKKSLLDQGYSFVSCTQVDGYGFSYAVQCVVAR